MHCTSMHRGIHFAFLTTLIAITVACTAQSSERRPDKPAAPVTRTSIAGIYDGGQMEVGAQLTLKPNGHFTYELAYGAMDEAAAGTWELKDGAVFLTTVPAVVPPRFVVVSDTPEPAGGLWITVSNGPVMEGARQRIYLLYAKDAAPDMAEVADDGHVPLAGNRMPIEIIPEIPVYPVMGKPIALSGTGGHRLVLRFEPNDIGKADFRATRLEIANGVLVMRRNDLELELHFRRQP